MEKNIFEENQSFLRDILRKFYNEETLIIKSLECSSGSEIGDNYMSVVNRLRTTIKFNNCEKEISLILKSQIPSLSRRTLFRCDDAFDNEISAYKYVIPILRNFIIKRTKKNLLPYPVCIFAENDKNVGDVIILEDLCEKGFNMTDRRKGLTYQQCCGVMKNLSILHATSIAMKIIEPIKFQQTQSKITEIVFCPEAFEFYTRSLESSLREALSSLRKSNRKYENLTDPIKEVEKLSGKLYQQMYNCVQENDEKWKVLCHGDLWINNLMFKSSDVKLIDLQSMRYTSLVIDIQHLIYSSTESDVRIKYYDEIISCYHKYLMENLELLLKLDYLDNFKQLEKVFSLENIKQELDQKCMYALGMAMWLLPAITFHPNNTPDLDSVEMDDFLTDTQEKNMTEMQTAEYHERIKDVVLEFYDKKYFKLSYD